MAAIVRCNRIGSSLPKTPWFRQHRHSTAGTAIFLGPLVVAGIYYFRFLPKRERFAESFGRTITTEGLGTIEYNVHGEPLESVFYQKEPGKALSLDSMYNKPKALKQSFKESINAWITESAKVSGSPDCGNSNVKISPGAVLFFHDVPGGVDQYPCLNLMTGLEFPYPTITVGRPGYFRSSLLRRSPLSEICDSNKFILKEVFGIGDIDDVNSTPKCKVHVAAVGRGGLYALQFARRYPALTSSLTLLSAQTRPNGFTLRDMTGATAHFEGKRLEALLRTQINMGGHFLGTVAELGNVAALKRGSWKAFAAVIKNQYGNSVPETVWKAVVDHWKQGANFVENGGPGRAVVGMKEGSVEAALAFLRMLGQGHTAARRLGIVNDVCNISDVDLCLDGLDTTAVAYSNVVREALRLREKELESMQSMQRGTKLASEPSGSETSVGPECAADVARQIEELERLRRQEITSFRLGHVQTVDNVQKTSSVSAETPFDAALNCWENGDALKEVQCPTLVLHSPHDGHLSFSTHAMHAAKFIPRANLQVLKHYPHTLSLKSSTEINKLIQQHMLCATTSNEGTSVLE